MEHFYYTKKGLMSMNPKKALFALLTLVLCISTTAEEQWTWTLRRSGPEHLNAVAAGNGMFVAVGDSGAILTSPDGIDWVTGNSGTNVALYSVIWGGEQFVAVGDSGMVVTSPDGMEWTVRNSGKDYRIGSVAYGDGKYVALAGYASYPGKEYTYVLISDDGIGWTGSAFRPDYGFMPISTLMKIAYGGGRFIGGNSDMNILNSTDGINWDFSPGRSFYPCGNNALDPCGPPFVPVPCMPSAYDILSITYGNGMFLVIGDGGARARTVNGNEWELIEPSCGRHTIGAQTAIYDGTRFVIAGAGGIFVADRGGNSSTYSFDHGAGLEQISTKKFNPWSVRAVSMAYNGNVYVTTQGTEIGTLSKGSSSVISKQNTKFTSGIIVRQSGKMLQITMPNQNTSSQVALFNIAGKRQRVKPVFNSDGSVSMSLSNLAAGSYILRVNDGKNSWQRRIMVR